MLHVSPFRIITVITLLFAFLFLINDGVNARSQAVITVEEARGVVGETITVPVTIKDSGGMAGGDVVISYDPDILEIKDIKMGDVISGTIFMPNPGFAKDKIKFLWAKAEMDPITEDGNIALLSFLLKKPGESALEIIDTEVLDIHLQEIAVEGESGKIVVSENGISGREPNTTDNGAGEAVPDPVPDLQDENGDADGEIREGPAVLSVDNVSGAVGDEVTVTISIENPSGMAGGNMVLSYDPQIVEPQKVKTGNLLSGLIPISNLEYSENSLSIVWVGLTGKTSDGEVAGISFLIKEEGRSDLVLEEMSLVNAEGEDIAVEVVHGSISSSENGLSVAGNGGDYYVFIIIVILLLAAGLGVYLFMRNKKSKGEDIQI